MSESSSLHSAKLVSLARSLSGLGFDATNGGLANPNPSPDNDDPPLPVGLFSECPLYLLSPVDLCELCD